MINKDVVVEKKFSYKGRECIIIFCCLGYRCGYVSLKNDEIKLIERDFFGKKVTEIDYDSMNIDCHGGLTFGNKLSKGYKPKYEYYIGFDCAHWADGRDLKRARKLGLRDCSKDFLLTYIGEPVSLKACVKDCKSIVDQLNEKKELKNT